MSNICVVGAGAAGAILAVQLLRYSKHEVLLFDIDDISHQQSNNSPDLLDVDFSEARFNVPFVSQYGFGGTTRSWHGLMTNLEEPDLQKQFGDSWRKVLEELDVSINALGSLVEGIDHLRYSNDPGIVEFHDEISKLIQSSGKVGNKPFVLQKSPLRTRELLRGLQHEPRLRLFTNSIVLSIASIRYGDTSISRLAYFDRIRNERREVEVDTVILCAGTIESARILLQSKRDGLIRLNCDVIGKNLVDHPWTIAARIKSKEPIKFRRTDVRLSQRLRLRCGLLISVPSDTGSTGVFTNNCVVLKPEISTSYLLFIEALKAFIFFTSWTNAIRGISKIPFRDISRFVRYILYERFGLAYKSNTACAFVYLEQLPADSQVVLTEVLDRYGRLVPKVLWHVSDGEISQFGRVTDVMERSLAGSDFLFERLPINRNTVYSGCHLSGTCRVGNSSANSVVDENLKVHGFSNLYVCDLSVLGCSGNSNPTLTIFALADRLARLLSR